jgi:hypothetical protein
VDPHAQFLASELRACLGRAFQGNRRTEAAMFDAMARKTELAPV